MQWDPLSAHHLGKVELFADFCLARLPQLLVNINKQPMVDVLLHDNAKNMHACLATAESDPSGSDGVFLTINVCYTINVCIHQY